MKYLPVLALLGLAACDPTTGQFSPQLACQFDKQVQPVAAQNIPVLTQDKTAITAMSVDQLLVHPAVLAYCKSLGGVPVKTEVKVGS